MRLEKPFTQEITATCHSRGLSRAKFSSHFTTLLLQTVWYSSDASTSVRDLCDYDPPMLSALIDPPSSPFSCPLGSPAPPLRACPRTRPNNPRTARNTSRTRSYRFRSTGLRYPPVSRRPESRGQRRRRGRRWLESWQGGRC